MIIPALLLIRQFGEGLLNTVIFNSIHILNNIVCKKLTALSMLSHLHRQLCPVGLINHVNSVVTM